MKFSYRYHGSSHSSDNAAQQALSLAPDTLRPPTHFDAGLQPSASWAFREALSALHAVVVNDQTPRGRDPSAYQRWLADNEGSLLAQFMQRAGSLREQVSALHAELGDLRRRKDALLQPFYKARSRYFNWLYEANREAWFVLDPVISVHPERLLFEAFSQDESSYCAVSVSHNVFAQRGAMACGTTNIDYSPGLFEAFQKIRDYKQTRFTVDPGGFGVASGDNPEFREEKIDLPDSWVRGFLQVSSAATLPATVLELQPMDLHNLCAALRQRRERAGPRSLRVELQPSGACSLLLEPWGLRIVTPRARLLGEPPAQPQSIRLWGRRRLLLLERLIPVATRLRVHLLGSGLPSFWVVELPDITVTLGLSGWTANDWSAAGRFDLLAPRQHVPQTTLERVATALQARWQASVAELVQACALPAAEVSAALTLWVQAGRAVFDLPAQRYAWRELSREPLPLQTLRFASPEEERALQLVQAGGVRVQGLQALDGGRQQLDGEVREGKRQHHGQLLLDADERLLQARCDCNFFQQNQLRRGPCAHLLALRQKAQVQLNERRRDA